MFTLTVYSDSTDLPEYDRMHTRLGGALSTALCCMFTLFPIVVLSVQLVFVFLLLRLLRLLLRRRRRRRHRRLSLSFYQCVCVCVCVLLVLRTLP
jgi:Flp pilus assembly protein TadB